MMRTRRAAVAVLSMTTLLALPALASAAPPNTWTSAAGPLLGRFGHVAAPLPSGKVLITGGERDFATPLSAIQIYDPASDQWSTAMSMGTARVLAGATTLPNGKVLVVGRSATSSSNGLNTAEVYDPASDTWIPVTGTMTDGRGEFPIVVLLPDGKVLIAGGTNASGSATTSANLNELLIVATDSAGSKTITKVITVRR